MELDQHHDECKDYILNGNHDHVYLPPTADTEFKNIEKKIRNGISSGVRTHRHRVQRNVHSNLLDDSGIRYIRDGLLDKSHADRAYTFLYKYYDQLENAGSKVHIHSIISDLNNIETEAYVDRSQKFGGWKSLIQVWSQPVPNYPNVRSQLLVHEGDDPDVCVDSHHIAEDAPTKPTMLATTNPKHFCRKRAGESESRKDNIVRVTSVSDVLDKSGPLRP